MIRVDLKLQIRKEGMSTFTQGTYFTYLRSNKDGTYGITTYPLGLVNFTDYVIDGEPLLYMDMQITILGGAVLNELMCIWGIF